MKIKILKHIVMVMAMVLAGLQAQAAQDGRLHGKITDAADGEPLIGVYVYFPALGAGAVTDVDGNYEITGLPSVRTSVQVSYLGHKTIIKDVNLAEVSLMDFRMEESDAAINASVVTGLAGETLLKDTPTPISVVDGRELQMTASTNIVDAVARQPGVSQITTGGGISKPVIRGLGYNRIVVINDGIRQEGQQWGDEHGIEIDPRSVNSVEIIKGPASLMYGSDAMAGVLIFHGGPLPPQGGVTANMTGEYQSNSGLWASSTDFSGNKDGFVWSGIVSAKAAHDYRNAMDGYVHGSRFSEKAASLMGGLNKSWGYSHLKFSYYHITPGIVEGWGEEGEEEEPGTAGEGGRYSKVLPFQQIHHYKAVLDNNVFLGDNGSLKVLLGYQQNRREEYEESAEEPGLYLQLHTMNYDARYVAAFPDNLKFSAGIGGMYQRSVNRGDEFLIPDYGLFDIGAFSTAQWSRGRWNLSGGLRYDFRHISGEAMEDRFSDFGKDFNALSGSIGAVYNVSDAVNVRANVSRGFRAPNISELSANGEHEGTFRYEVGSTELGAEKSLQADLGMDWSTSVISGQIALFANRIDNYIFAGRVKDAVVEGVPVYHYTSGDARLLGGEITVDIHPVNRLHFQNAFSYVNSRLLNQPEESRWLPFTPAPKFTSDLRYDIITHGRTFDDTYIGIGVEYDFRQDHFYAEGGTETATPDYTLVGISAGTDLKVHGRKVASLSVSVENLFDKVYQNHLSRLKYIGINPETGKMGVFNMGRNFCFKLEVPLCR